MRERDHYGILGVGRGEDTARIRRAFKERALAVHPDRAGPLGKAEFERIAEAYRVLSDPARRARYDEELRRAEGPPPPRRSARQRTAELCELDLILSPAEAARGGAVTIALRAGTVTLIVPARVADGTVYEAELAGGDLLLRVHVHT